MALALQEPHCTVTSLAIKYHCLGPTGTRTLISSIMVNATALRELDISRNEIGLGGAAAVADLLGRNCCPNLKRLWLELNDIPPEGVSLIAKSLWYNNHLEEIDLHGNHVGGQGANEIAEMLQHNTTLESIFLEENGIGPQGAISIANALGYQKNCTLQQLDLGDNCIGDEGARALARALYHNPTLSLLSLWANRFETEHLQEEVENLAQEVEARHSLQKVHSLAVFLQTNPHHAPSRKRKRSE